LMNRRTVVSYKDLLIGRDEYLVPLIKESLKIASAKYMDKSTVLDVEIENTTSSAFTLQNKSKYTFHEHSDIVMVQPGERTHIQVKTKEKLGDLELSFEVLNAIHAPNSHPTVAIPVKIQG